MKSRKTLLSLCLLVTLIPLLRAAPARAGAQESQQMVEPFKIFDNLYYIGMDWVSAYLLTTSDGLIMLDSLYGAFANEAIENVRKLGFDPDDIRYVIATHGHGDHAGGVGTVQSQTGARIGMAAGDWAMLGGTPEDIVIDDGDSITLGDTTLQFYLTPGHTLGVVSIEFGVRDGDESYKAFMFGGMGLNFSGVDRTEMYLNSVGRVRAMEGIEVNLTNHPGPAKIFERAALLEDRAAGVPHPFVAPADFSEWMRELQVNAEEKLVDERRAEAP